MFALPPGACDNFLGPTLDELRRELEAVQVAPALEQISNLTASIARLADERQAAEKEISRLRLQAASLEATLTSIAAERRRVQDRLEHASRDIEARNQALGQLSDEVAAWDDARRWRVPPSRERLDNDQSPFKGLRRRRLLKQARRAAAARQWSVAAEKFAAVLGQSSDIPFIWVEYGHALKESGAITDAILAYRKVLLLMPDHPDVEMHLSDLLRRV